MIGCIFEEKTGERKRNSEEDERFSHLRMEQAFLLGKPEVDYLTALAKSAALGDENVQAALEKRRKKKSDKPTEQQREIAAKLTKNIKALTESARVPRSVESALFGRMVTSDFIANTDAAIHVAHAFTVHAEATESDYFTVVDDLKQEASESGAGGLFDTELTAGLFYGYVVIDLPLLTSNLGDDPALAAKVVEHLVHLIATVSPGAKKGSTAPYAYAEFMLAEAGVDQPRTLANAFRRPCRADTEAATTALTMHLGKVDAAYGANGQRRHLAVEPIAVPSSEALALPALAKWAAEQAGAVS